MTKIYTKWIYRHFKGNDYIVHEEGRHTETGELLVVCQEWTHQAVGPIRIYPRDKFTSTVRDKKGRKIPRFKPVRYSNPLPESPDEW
jgi:hypothetical protein